MYKSCAILKAATLKLSENKLTFSFITHISVCIHIYYKLEYIDDTISSLFN